MAGKVEEVLAAIARLTPRERAELKRQLAQFPWWARNEENPASHSARAEWEPDFVVVFDGGSVGNPGRGYGSFLLTRQYDGQTRHRALELGAHMTSNEAEYDTLIAALKDLQVWIRESGGDVAHTSVEVRGDSQLVIRQVSGRWRVREPRMLRRRDEVNRLLALLGSFRLVEQPREESVRLLGH